MITLYDTTLQARRDIQSLRIKRPDGIFVDAQGARRQTDGVWIDVWPVKKYLYKSGDECTAVTGGWNIYPYKTTGMGSMSASGTLEKGDNLVLSITGKGLITSLWSNLPIDMTGYRKIRIDCSIRGGSKTGAWFVLSKNKEDNFTRIKGLSMHYHGTYQSMPISINVEALKTSCYVVVEFETNIDKEESITIQISKIWLEK